MLWGWTQGSIILLRNNMIKGTYIFYENGKEIYRSPNLITKFGKRFMTNLVAGNITNNKKDMAFGIDSAAPTIDDTRLGFEFYRLPVIISSTDIRTENEETTYSVVYKTTIPQDVAGVISEVGLYPSTRLSTNNYDSKFISDFSDFLSWEDSSGYNPSTSLTGSKVGDSLLLMSSSSTSANEYQTNIYLDISGYSINDSLKISYYKQDANLQSIKIKFYTSDTDYYIYTLTPASGTGYKLSSDISLNDLFSAPVGSPNKSEINKVGIVVTPTAGNTTSVGMDGLRINDEDTFDPILGLISRSVLNVPLTKLAGRQVDVEYKLDLSF